MIIGHPGTWQQFQFRPDNKGLNVMEMKSKYLHEQYLFEAQMNTLNQIHQQNTFMNGVGGGPVPSSPSGPILEAGARIIFSANSISDVNTDLGWNIENIEDWKNNAFNTINGEITYLTVVETFPQTFEVNIGGLLGLEVEVGDNAFANSTTISSVGLTDTIGVEGIIRVVGISSFRNSSITVFDSFKCQQVGASAFRQSPLLIVTIGNGTENLRLDEAVFLNCTSLETINFIFNEIDINGNDVFSGCTNLLSISSFGYKITNMNGNNIFAGCTGLTSVIIGSENGTFTGVIGDNCFDGCTNLNSFILYNVEGDPVNQTIGSSMFLDCTSLSSITILNLLTLSGVNIFEGVVNIGNANFKTDQDNNTYDPNDNILFLDTSPNNWVINYT
jgi:hypothetical protein